MTLRPLEPEDLSLVYEIENDPAMWEVGTPAGPYSKFALRQYLAQEPQDLFERGELRLVITTDAGEAAGLLDLLRYSPTDRSAEVGIAVRRAYRSQGLALQALHQLASHCLNLLNLRQLYARVAVGNTASRHLFAEAGYEDVATLPQWHYAGGRYVDLVVVRKVLAP